MHDEELCETEVLAKSRFCVIARCTGCRSFHVHLGAVSLRLREEIFCDICETLAKVYVRINHSGDTQSHTLHNH